MIARKQKILLVLVSLAISLLFIESIARLAGVIYTAYRIRNKHVTTQTEKPIIKIICLGDSFTFGMGAGSGQGYPDQLEKILNENIQDKKFIIFNRGIPGNNSSMVLKNLVGNINTYRPDIVFLLIGSNDSTTLSDSDCYLFKSLSFDKIASFSLELDALFSNLKTYKMIKIVTLNLKNKFMHKVDFEDIDAQEELDYPKVKIPQSNYRGPNSKQKERYLRLAESLCSENKFSDAEKIIADMPEGIDLQDRRECVLLSDIYSGQGKYDSAINIIKIYIQDNPEDAQFIFRLGENYYYLGENNGTVNNEDYQQAAELFRRSLSCADPSDLRLKIDNYSYLARTYFAQGDNVSAQRMTGEALKIRPNNRFLRQFKRVISESRQTEQEKEIFRKLLYYNLSRIINLCQVYNIRIVLLNYPNEGKGGIRAEIAHKYKIPFVDIGDEFAQALSKYSRKDLFSSDQAHPNSNGYRIMAETIFKAFTAQKFGVF
ncbi:MAG: GDSL-type esterase/lipase family protein [Candidatus Omnitrophica bacterium]|nr:GDSL-type esterase/lipase family protein [Candidatus Omnitrophota bacterium]